MSDKDALSHLNLILTETDNELLESRYNWFAGYIEWEFDLNGHQDLEIFFKLKVFLFQFVKAKKLLDKYLN